MSRWYEEPGAENDTVISTRVRLSRNLIGVPFPARMTAGDRRNTVRKIHEAVFDPNSSLSKAFQFIAMEELTDDQAVSLVERRLAGADFISAREGRALMHTADEAAVLTVNGGEHLLIQVTAGGLELNRAFEQADRIDTILNKRLQFAFDPEFGYLTQSPVDLGTGMITSVFLHLPALTDSGATVRISANLSKLGLYMRGVYGPAAKPLGAVYQLSNHVTLGLSEAEALANLQSMTLQLIAQERAAREKIVRNVNVKDTIWRSLGILLHARLLSTEEFFSLISVVRLGVAAKEICGLSYEKIMNLMLRVQPATLAEESGRKMTSEEQKALRAELVRGALKGAGQQ